MRSGSSLLKLQFRVAKDGETELAKVEVAGVVVVEGSRAVVVEKRVDFDDEPMRAPEGSRPPSGRS